MKLDPRIDDDARQVLIKAAARQVKVEQRALEVFSQLLKIPQFNEWMGQHIIIRDEVDHDKKQITTYVIYKDDATQERKVDSERNGSTEGSEPR